MRIPLTISLFTVILVVALTLTLSIVGYSYSRQKEAAYFAFVQIMERSSEILHLRTETLLKPIELIAGRSGSWPGVSHPPSQLGHPSFGRIRNLMEAFPQVAAINLGYQDGSYYMLATLQTRGKDEIAQLQPPEDAYYLERIIQRGLEGDGRPLSRFFARDGRVLGVNNVGPEDFDPRMRPWYRSVWYGSGEARSQVYMFHGSGQPGLTVSKRHASGVVGIDITLRQLEDFLKADDLADEGVLAVLDSDRQVLARAGDSAKAQAVLGALTKRLSSDADFFTDRLLVGDDYWIAHVEPAPFGKDSREVLALALPVSVLAAPLIEVYRNALLISVAIVLAAVPLIWLVSRGLSRPLRDLAGDARRLRHFDLRPREFRPSVVDEIYQLQTSLARSINSLGIFGSYVPKTLVRGFLERDVTPALGGENRDITVLFMDIENFTAMSADISAEETMRRMSDLFEAVTQALLAHDATIDKYIGDAVMAFWNAPDDVIGHERLACQAALAVRQAATDVIATWPTGDVPHLRPRIGLHSGEAIVGNVGSSDRMNYTALGATVNLAARLEAANRDLGTDILVSREIVTRLEANVDVRLVGAVDLKGFKEPAECYELLGMRDAKAQGEPE